jgi:hypothetical protein
MSAIRTPSPQLRQWDEAACETACTAQLLISHGKLDYPFDTKAFDKRVGRKRHNPDWNCGNLRVILEEGFEVVQISPVDLHRVAVDYDYVRSLWIGDGTSPSDTDTYLPQEYPEIRKRAHQKLKLIARYRSCYKLRVRPPTWGDISGLLQQDYQVQCSISMPPGAAHDVLITRQLGINRYEVFDPMAGLTRSAPFKIMDSIIGYRCASPAT